MYRKSLLLCAVFLLFLGLQAVPAQDVARQEPQIPNIFLNNKTEFKCGAVVHVDQRKSLSPSLNGDFSVDGFGGCLPPNYPTGKITVKINMNDSSITYFESTTIEAMSSTGKITPIAWVMGRCNIDNEKFKGCHFWIQFTNNNNNSNEQSRQTPNIISFLVVDGTGMRLSYGTGVVVKGTLTVAPTIN
jgi:hypothetical protein